MRETVLEQSKQRTEMKKRTAAVLAAFDPIYHNTGSFGRVQGADGGKIGEIQIEHQMGKSDGWSADPSGSGGWRPQQRNRVCCPTGRISDRSDCSADSGRLSEGGSRRRQFWRGRRCTGRWTGRIRSRNRR